MKIAIANDHAATDLKMEIMAYLQEKGHEVVNFGTDGHDSVNYPEYAEPAANAVASGECDLGVLICGSGVGVSLCANKVNGIRCVVCSEPYSAQMSRRHNNTNMLAFGARVVGPDMAKMIVDAWLDAEFEGGRHQTRVDMMMDIERRNRGL